MTKILIYDCALPCQAVQLLVFFVNDKNFYTHYIIYYTYFETQINDKNKQKMTKIYQPPLLANLSLIFFALMI